MEDVAETKSDKHKNWANPNSIFRDGYSFKGFLISCDANKEKLAVRDSYKILNEYFEKLSGQEIDEEVKEMDDLILKKLKGNDTETPDSKVDKRKNQKFYQIKVNARGVTFIKIEDNLFSEDFDMETMISKIFEDVIESKSKLSRSICRMIPVEVGCLASMNNFKSYIKDLISKHFNSQEESKTWSMAYKCRNNNKFSKDQFLNIILELIPSNYRQLTYNGDITLFVDITQHLMCLGVYRLYNKFNKFSFETSLNKVNKEGLTERED